MNPQLRLEVLAIETVVLRKGKIADVSLEGRWYGGA